MHQVLSNGNLRLMEFPALIRKKVMQKAGVLLLAMMALALILSPGARPAELAAEDVIEVIEAPQANPEDVSRERAAEANRAAASDSVASMKISVQPALDIRETGHTSVLIAGSR